MAGLPAGAAQTVVVPQELRTYEHITSIEYIEIDPSVPCPLSAAYRPIEGGAQMLIRRETPDLQKLTLTVDEAEKLIADLNAAGFFDLNRVYCPAQGTFRVAATEWRIEVDFDQKLTKRSNAYMSEGEAEFPDSYDRIVSILVGERIKTVEINE